MKKIILGFVIFFSAMTFPSHTYAQAPFGGLETFEFPCTCSAFTMHFFSPLYLGTLVPTVGWLAAPFTPLTFLFYYLAPSFWALGTYTPGVQACYMYVGLGCAPVPGLGVILPLTGTGPII